MITKSSVKVQKSFKVEFTLDESEMNKFCQILCAGVCMITNDKDFDFYTADDFSFIRELRDYVLDLRDRAY